MRAFRIAYDGRPFSGFQRQPDVATVEDVLLDALESLDVLDPEADAGAGLRPTPPGYAAAGRTDAGVSAAAQTVAFQAPAWLTPRVLSAELPASIHAWARADVPAGEPSAAADFHATHDATERTYRYFLHAPEADPERAAAVLDAVAGEHDFRALTPDESGTVRTLRTCMTTTGPHLVLEVTAGGFPRHLVRRLAALVEIVANGGRPIGIVEDVLAASLPEDEGIPNAPAEPLVLAYVTYPELSFTVDPDAADEARAAIGALQAEAATRQQVAGAMLGTIDG